MINCQPRSNLADAFSTKPGHTTFSLSTHSLLLIFKTSFNSFSRSINLKQLFFQNKKRELTKNSSFRCCVVAFTSWNEVKDYVWGDLLCFREICTPRWTAKSKQRWPKNTTRKGQKSWGLISWSTNLTSYNYLRSFLRYNF